MKFFSILDQGEIHLSSEKKVMPGHAFSKLLTAEQMLEKVQQEEKLYRLKVAQECETLKSQAQTAGYESGLEKWNEQIALLEAEIKKVRQETESAVVSLALTAVKKIIGKELETRPQTIADIVATALRSVLHHRKISIIVNQLDLEYVEAEKPRFKALFERLESLSVTARADVEPGGCIIETESGIINAKLENQLFALESAFRTFFQNRTNEK